MSFIRHPICLAICLLTASAARAEIFEWANPVSGLFNSPASWVRLDPPFGSLIPGVGDEILLNEVGSYTITLAQNEAAGRIFQTAGNVSLRSSTATVQTLDLTSGVADLIVRGGGGIGVGSPSNPVALTVGDQAAIGSVTGDGFATVSGVGSRLDALGNGTHTIGSSGFSGSLSVLGGAAADFGVNGSLEVGVSGIDTSSGSVTVKSTSTLNTGSVNLATADSLATGIISVNDVGTSVNQTLPGATLTVGSPTTGAGTISVGSGGSYTTGDGAVLIDATGVVSVNTGTFNANGPVTMNAGSSLTLLGSAAVNAAAGLDNSAGGTLDFQDGTLTVTGGAFAPSSSTSLKIEGPSAAEQPHLVIGAGATASASDEWFVAESNRGKLTIQDGGQVSNLFITLGAVSDAEGEATVTGAGSTWSSSNSVRVGRSGAGTLTVEAGGLLDTRTGTIGDFVGSDGDVTVTGAGSRWDVLLILRVGNTGEGTLLVEAGGRVDNTVGVIGDEAGADGDATVTGAGSVWDNSVDLLVGDLGAGTLDVNDGGLVQVGGTTTINAQSSVTLDGGRLEFGSIDLDSYRRIGGAGGSLAGDLPTLVNTSDAAALNISLNNEAIDVSDVLLRNDGVLFGDATVDAALVNRAAGEIETSPGDRLRFRGAGNTNAGEINNFGGQVRFDGDATNEATGFVGGRGQFIADGGWTNDGVMAFSAGPADLLGDVVNNGTIITSGAAVTTFFDDLTHNGPEISTSAGSATVVFGAASGSGPYTGAGTVFFEGDLRPGDSPGVVTFAGDVALGETSRTVVELAGLAVGAFDRLEIAGTLSAGGDLEVEVLPGFQPSPGDQFEIITTGAGLTGAFGPSTQLPLAGGLAVDVLYTADTVTLQVVGVAGDYNSDGVVDAADYTVYRDTLGQTGPGLAADGDLDGDVDANDHAVWAANLGATEPESALAVPEPTGALMLLIATALASTRPTQPASRTR